MATTEQLIAGLYAIANNHPPFIFSHTCHQAAERLGTLYKERKAAADEIDRVEAKYKALLEKAIADIPHYCSNCAYFIEEGRGCKRDYKCAWKWRGEE